MGTAVEMRSLHTSVSRDGYLNRLRNALASFENSWDARFKFAPVARTLIIDEYGVFLGATKLAPRVLGFEQSIHVLVSYAAGAVAPTSLIPTLEAAEADYRAGDMTKCAMRLALSVPTPPTDEQNCRKLHIAAGLIHMGLISAPDLLAIAAIPGADEFYKYSPDQPRVPAGHSDGGQWTREDSGNPGGERSTLMEEGCAEEWRWARDFCLRLLTSPDPPRGLTGGHTTIEGCAKGFVSERCGGNKV